MNLTAFLRTAFDLWVMFAVGLASLLVIAALVYGFVCLVETDEK